MKYALMKRCALIRKVHLTTQVYDTKFALNCYTHSSHLAFIQNPGIY